MTTTQINTAELTGAAFDWAVAQVAPGMDEIEWKWDKGIQVMLGHFKDGTAGEVFVRPKSSKQKMQMLISGSVLYSPSTDWAQGGPLLGRYGIEFISEDDGFEATAWNDKRTIGCMGWGKDHLTAACRAIIVKELGETVSVPTELVEGGV